MPRAESIAVGGWSVGATVEQVAFDGWTAGHPMLQVWRSPLSATTHTVTPTGGTLSVNEEER